MKARSRKRVEKVIRAWGRRNRISGLTDSAVDELVGLIDPTLRGVLHVIERAIKEDFIPAAIDDARVKFTLMLDDPDSAFRRTIAGIAEQHAENAARSVALDEIARRVRITIEQGEPRP